LRIIRYQESGQQARWGRIDEQDRVVPLADAPWDAALDQPADGPRLDQVQLLAPTTPTKIIGVGRNYAAHAAEHKVDLPEQPLIFFKPPSAVIGPGEVIRLPAQSSRVEHEAELAVVIGRPGRWIEEQRAFDHVLGYCVGLDITARDLQRSDAQWTRGKGFDTFCPLGPWIETDLEPAAVEVSCFVNDELQQRGSSSEMVFSIPYLIAYISAAMTLMPGDVILTGTPAGVGPLTDGDRIEAAISDIGAITHDVRVD
jgi:2-keto-4-pentenoate hydratase/2-oxohepta-3-ene-1,7-dioic acid hydratase in catechol pathway